MGINAMRTREVRAVGVAWVVVLALGLSGCAGEVSDVERAETRVAAKEKA